MTCLKLIMCFGAILMINPCHGIIDEVAQWGFVNYNFPVNTAHRRLFRPDNTALTGLEVGWDRIYLAAPRLRPGVPATLSSIPRNIPPGSSPVLEAFPDWSWHGAGVGDFNCSGLISVYRIRTDRCNRLWVLDSGIMDSIDNFTSVCPPKIVIFDMKTHRPLRSIRLPQEVLRMNTLTTNLIIDHTHSNPAGQCNDVFVYISDTAAPGMIIYDGRTDRTWRVTHASMYPDPEFSDYRIGEDTFTLMDGIVGLAFSPKQQLVYFHPLATDRTFMISTAALQRGPPPKGQELPVKLAGRKSSQGLGIDIDPNTDTFFYSPLTETAIASWNPITNQHEVIDYDPERLQFAAELRWIEKDGGTLWALTSAFQRFFLKTASPSIINIRVLRILPNYNPYQQLSRGYRQVNSTSYY